MAKGKLKESQWPVGSREPGGGSREPEAGSREPGAGSRAGAGRLAGRGHTLFTLSKNPIS